MRVPVILIMFTVTSLILAGLSGCNEDVESFNYSISWTMDNLSPGTNSVLLAESDSDTDELRLAVDLNSITNGPTHGIYFDLVFRDEVFYFDSFEKGFLLEEAGTAIYSAALDPQDTGRLIVGASLLEDKRLENADGVLMYIVFKPLRSGTCPVGFENARIVTPDNGGTVPVTGVSWYGGYATVLE